MTHVYADDAILVSPSGKIVRASAALKAYYVARFAAGAKNHATTIHEVHVQGDGGYGIGTFAVTIHEADGMDRRENGNIVTVYKHTSNGWHLALVIYAYSDPAPDKHIENTLDAMQKWQIKGHKN